MKYLFFVQGEGRGHLSQAISLAQELSAKGHVLSGVVVGKPHSRQLPAYFKQAIKAPLLEMESLSFAIDKQGKGVSLNRSLLLNLKNCRKIISSYQKIKLFTRNLDFDRIINFYEPLGGIFCRFAKKSKNKISFSVGHQYFLEHPKYPHLAHSRTELTAFKLYNKIASAPKDIKLALSFSQEEDLPNKKIFVCPPIIRKEIRELTVNNQGFILNYILNAGYQEEIKKYAASNKNIKIESFWDKDEKEIFENIVFYPLNQKLFADKLASCQAYLSTAGFDSVAEAAYLGKEIFLVPTAGHFEQLGNAWDAQRTGIASWYQNFSQALTAIQTDKKNSAKTLKAFAEWSNNYADKLLNIIST